MLESESSLLFIFQFSLLPYLLGGRLRGFRRFGVRCNPAFSFVRFFVHSVRQVLLLFSILRSSESLFFAVHLVFQLLNSLTFTDNDNGHITNKSVFIAHENPSSHPTAGSSETVCRGCLCMYFLGFFWSLALLTFAVALTFFCCLFTLLKLPPSFLSFPSFPPVPSLYLPFPVTIASSPFDFLLIP